MDITVRNTYSNKCNTKGWLQGSLVVDETYTCRNYSNDIGLYIAGDYTPLNGQVRNFSYIKQ